MYSVTGDTHGDFDEIIHFTKQHANESDVTIVLGDAGINYWGDWRDLKLKNYISSNVKGVLFIVHGNHEMNPEHMGLAEKVWNDGIVYYEENYPKILYAKDGEIYNIDGMKTLVLGGAYSVDKYYRLERNYHWFEDEQMSDEEKSRCLTNIANHNWEVDVVLSHTVPYNYQPFDMFLSGVDQSTVDNSMEKWLQEIHEKLDYSYWFAGHFHCDRTVDKITILYNDFREFPKNRIEDC